MKALTDRACSHVKALPHHTACPCGSPPPTLDISAFYKGNRPMAFLDREKQLATTLQERKSSSLLLFGMLRGKKQQEEANERLRCLVRRLPDLPWAKFYPSTAPEKKTNTQCTFRKQGKKRSLEKSTTQPGRPGSQRAKSGLDGAAAAAAAAAVVALPPALLVPGVVFFHLRLALLDRGVEQEYERRQRESPYDVGRRIPELRPGDERTKQQAERSKRAKRNETKRGKSGKGHDNQSKGDRERKRGIGGGETERERACAPGSCVTLGGSAGFFGSRRERFRSSNEKRRDRQRRPENGWRLTHLPNRVPRAFGTNAPQEKYLWEKSTALCSC